MQSAGLEISSEKVALLALKKKGSSFSVYGLVTKELPEGTIIGGVLKKPEIFTQYLSLLKKESKPRKINSPYVVVSLPGELVYLTVKSMPEIPEDQIREALEINLTEFLPGKTKEIFWGYQVIEGRSKKEVILASVRKIILQDYLKAITAAGFIPIAIEPSSLSVARTLKRLEKPALILEFEKNHCLAVFIDQGDVNFSISFVYNQQDLAKEVKKALVYYKAKKQVQDLDIFVGGPKSEEIIAILKKDFGDVAKLAKDQILFKNLMQESNILLGAAMRGLLDQKEDRNLSLLPVGTAEGYEEKRALGFVGGITRLFIITCILFIIIFYGTWGLLAYLDRTTTNQLSIATKTKSDSQVADISKNLTALQPKYDYMQKVLAGYLPMAPKLQAVADAQPPNASLQSITMAKDSGMLVITGSGENRDTLAMFKDNLERSKAFSKVTIATTNVAESKVSFTINLNLK